MDEIIIRQDVEGYMESLRQWLTQTRETPMEEMSAFFTQRVDEYEGHMARWADAYRTLAARVPADARDLLDIGCGTGLELDALFARLPDIRVTGVDLTPSMLDRLRDKHGDRALRLICGDYFTVDLPTAAFDAALSFQTLHHFRPEKKAGLFCRLYRVLRPGGVYLECDYLACCDEEERILAQECRRRRAVAGVAEDAFVHFDTPLTAEHELSLLRGAGFMDAALVGCIEGASILAAHRP